MGNRYRRHEVPVASSLLGVAEFFAWSITSDKSKAALSTSADKGPERHDRAAAWWPAPRVRVDCRIARIGEPARLEVDGKAPAALLFSRVQWTREEATGA